MLGKQFTWNPSMDLSKQGLAMFFKPYQVALLKTLWTENRAMSSGECWNAIDRMKSRASVINFLDSATEYGIIEKPFITGKGGHRGMYRAAFSREGTKDYLRKMFTDRLESL